MAPDQPDEEHIETLKSSYLYLRLSLVGVVIAIFLAIAFTPEEYKPDGADILRSISHYYYTPARMVFTAALCAAAVALLTISGKGVQSYLLDLAALLAPLIAIVPTRTSIAEVGHAAELGACLAEWPTDTDCIPGDQLPFVAVGFGVWFCFALGGMALALVRGLSRLRDPAKREPVWYWIVLVLGIATVTLYGIWWLPAGFTALQMWGHLIAAGAFFVIIAVVVATEAVRQLLGEYTRQPFFFARRTYALIYGVLALILVTDIIVAAVILMKDAAEIGDSVFWIEVVGLSAFALFWVFQTLEHLKDADGWVSPSPPKTWKLENSSAPPSSK